MKKGKLMNTNQILEILGEVEYNGMSYYNAVMYNCVVVLPKEEFEEACEDELWIPEENERYCYINLHKDVTRTVYGSTYDKQLVNRWNFYKNEECASRALEEKSTAFIRWYKGNYSTFVPDWADVTERKYYVSFVQGEWKSGYTVIIKVPGVQHFSKEEVEKLIDILSQKFPNG